MKKLFTILAAALFSVSMMAQTTIFSATPLQTLTESFSVATNTSVEITDSWATIVGGTLTADNKHKNTNNFIMNIGGSVGYGFSLLQTATGLIIELNEAIQEGDVISVQAFTNGAGESNGRGIFVTTATARQSTADCILLGVSETAKEFVLVEHTVKSTDDICGKSKIYLWRATGNSTYFKDFAITRPAPTTDPVINASDASILAKESGVEATQDIAVVGANLTGSTLTATLSPAVEGLSVTLAENAITDGAIATTATLHYTQTENVPEGQTTLTLSDGTTNKEVTITYVSSVETWELQSISESTSWDFSKITRNTASTLHKNNGIQFTAESTPSYNDEIVYINYANGDLWTLADGFDGTTMAFKGEYPTRNNQYCQNGVLRFNTTVAGKIVVKFSDTGSSASKTAVKRYLVVNDQQTEYWTSRENNGDNPYDAQLNVTSGEIAVPAGDVTIKGSTAIVVSLVTFTQTYAVSCATPEHGSLSADKALAAAGEKVTLTVTPASGYQIASVKLDDESLVAEEGVYSFIMPAKAVNVTASFSQATAVENAEAAVKAVKVVENGQLVIIKNGVRYNAQGAVVK